MSDLLEAAKLAEHAMTEVLGNDDQASKEIAKIEQALGAKFDKSYMFVKLLKDGIEALRAAIAAEEARPKLGPAEDAEELRLLRAIESWCRDGGVMLSFFSPPPALKKLHILLKALDAHRAAKGNK